jgi:NADPH:quinone reductase-like Zn-dependent oxidoreductase
MPVGFSPALLLEAHNDMIEHWRNNELQISNNQIFPFEDALLAIEHIAAGKVEGKVIVSLQP